MPDINETIITGTGGFMEAVEQSPNTPYVNITHEVIEQFFADTIYYNYKARTSSNKTSEPVIKYIKQDDEDMGTTSLIKDMKPLEREEIERAQWVEEPEKYLLKSILSGRTDNLRVHNIGKIGFSNLPNIPGNASYNLIVGYRVNNKTITTNEEIHGFTKDVMPVDLHYIVYNLTTKKIELYNRRTLEGRWSTAQGTRKLKALELLKYKVISSELSGKVFGLGKIKAELVNTSPESVKIEFGESVRLKGSTYYASVFDKNTEKTMKFCLCDLEIAIPDIRGYNFPKDKTIKQNSDVIIKNNKLNTYKVVEIYPNPSSKRMFKNSQSRQLDVLRLVNINNPLDTHKIYAKNVKVVC